MEKSQALSKYYLKSDVECIKNKVNTLISDLMIIVFVEVSVELIEVS